jgi:formylglycine-generating enzyme required for sulfatase activity
MAGSSGPQTEPAHFEPDEVLSERYRIKDHLGVQYPLTIYRAMDLKIRRCVLLKVLNPDWAADEARRAALFKRVEAVSKFNHPHLVQVRPFPQRHDGHDYYVTDDAQTGVSLRQAILSQQVDAEAALSLILEVADGLADLHHAGCTHGAISPDVIWLMNGHAYLSGLAASGTIVAHKPFRAPEQSDEAAEPSADIYALAMTIIFALHGADLRSWSGINSLPTTPAVRAVLQRARSPHAGDRPATIIAFLQDLQTARTSQVTRTLNAIRRRWPLIAGAIAVGIAAWLMGSKPEPVPKVKLGAKSIEWVALEGGSFKRRITPRAHSRHPSPSHTVYVDAFELGKTEVTVGEYEVCVVAGACTAPKSSAWTECTWHKRDTHSNHPVNCVTWEQAHRYANWADARLPTEAEWMYAATSQGKNWIYPWGNEEADCSAVVMQGKPASWQAADGDRGCHRNSTWRVCSKPEGNSAQGVCDLMGNVWEWNEDTWADTFHDAPLDGSAWVEAGGQPHVIRGGAWTSTALTFDTYNRYTHQTTDYGIGFRLARSVEE